MAFRSPSRYSGHLAIELVHQDLICESTVTATSDFTLRVKHEQLARDVRMLIHCARNDTLFCEDVALIEHLYARAGKSVPQRIRQLMSTPPDIAHLTQRAEAREMAPSSHAMRIFLHTEQVTPSRTVASDGREVGFESAEWRLTGADDPLTVTTTHTQHDEDEAQN